MFPTPYADVNAILPRLLHDLQTILEDRFLGMSLPAAANWAKEALEQRWVSLIDHALAWQPDLTLDQLPETLAFIRYTLHRCQRFELA